MREKAQDKTSFDNEIYRSLEKSKLLISNYAESLIHFQKFLKFEQNNKKEKIEREIEIEKNGLLYSFKRAISESQNRSLSLVRRKELRIRKKLFEIKNICFKWLTSEEYQWRFTLVKKINKKKEALKNEKFRLINTAIIIINSFPVEKKEHIIMLIMVYLKAFCLTEIQSRFIVNKFRQGDYKAFQYELEKLKISSIDCLFTVIKFGKVKNNKLNIARVFLNWIRKKNNLKNLSFKWKGEINDFFIDYSNYQSRKNEYEKNALEIKNIIEMFEKGNFDKLIHDEIKKYININKINYFNRLSDINILSSLSSVTNEVKYLKDGFLFFDLMEKNFKKENKIVNKIYRLMEFIFLYFFKKNKSWKKYFTSKKTRRNVLTQLRNDKLEILFSLMKSTKILTYWLTSIFEDKTVFEGDRLLLIVSPVLVKVVNEIKEVSGDNFIDISDILENDLRYFKKGGHSLMLIDLNHLNDIRNLILKNISFMKKELNKLNRKNKTKLERKIKNLCQGLREIKSKLKNDKACARSFLPIKEASYLDEKYKKLDAHNKKEFLNIYYCSELWISVGYGKKYQPKRYFLLPEHSLENFLDKEGEIICFKEASKILKIAKHALVRNESIENNYLSQYLTQYAEKEIQSFELRLERNQKCFQIELALKMKDICRGIKKEILSEKVIANHIKKVFKNDIALYSKYNARLKSNICPSPERQMIKIILQLIRSGQLNTKQKLCNARQILVLIYLNFKNSSYPKTDIFLADMILIAINKLINLIEYGDPVFDEYFNNKNQRGELEKQIYATLEFVNRRTPEKQDTRKLIKDIRLKYSFYGIENTDNAPLSDNIQSRYGLSHS